MTLTPYEQIYNLVSVLKPMIIQLKEKGCIEGTLADSIIEELELLRK